MKHFVAILLAIQVFALCAFAEKQAKNNCGRITQLTRQQISEHAVHIEMEPDRMGNHTNLKGIAVFQIKFNEKGNVIEAKTISGHPLAISFLIGAAPKWQFKPYLQSGVARKACGELVLGYSMVENVPSIEVLSPSK